MRVQVNSGVCGITEARGAVVLVDAFRAFTTACEVLVQSPQEYLAVSDSKSALQLARKSRQPFLIGKPELGADLAYDLPNSPTRVRGAALRGRTVIHRTQAGMRGVMASVNANLVLLCAFANVQATVDRIRSERLSEIQVFALGHEGVSPSVEDDVCAALIRARLKGFDLSLSPLIERIRRERGLQLNEPIDGEFPEADLEACLALDRFPFAMRAVPVEGHACIERF